MDFTDLPPEEGVPTEAMIAIVANICGENAKKKAALTMAINQIVEDAVVEALTAERSRLAKLVEGIEPIIRHGAEHADLKATLEAAATRIRLGI